MTDKNKKDPMPEKKGLHPIFGTFCATQKYSLQPYKHGGSCHIHLEAYLLDPIAKTWGITRVMRLTELSLYTGRPISETRTQRLDQNIDFEMALKYLADFEKSCANYPTQYVPQQPLKEAMGFLHYKNFAEREGYVFNTSGYAQAKPNLHALPPGGLFTAEDIESAERNLQRPENEFNGTGPSSKIPQTHFLFDQFKRASHDRNMNSAVAEMRVTFLLQQFMAEVETVGDNLEEYCKNYLSLGQGSLITESEEAIERAAPILRQIKGYGIDIAPFESFLLQCKISCDILHAQGLYDLMQKNLGDFVQNEELFKSRVEKALASFKAVDGSDKAAETLKNMIVQSTQPKPPEAIRYFIDRYKQQRADYDIKKNPYPPHRPPAP